MTGNKLKTLILGLASASTLTVGADVATFDPKVIDDQQVQVAEEVVDVKQIANTVEATFPWKDQSGITVKYDMGEPTLQERMKDQRKQEVITETVTDFDGGFKVDILLNEKPTTNRFCYTIEGAENYDFFYQPPLTPEEIAEGASRPPEIEGSYAVYHKTLKNHRMGRENYATGKVMHIPRPQVWSLSDESTKVWADLSYNGQLCVTVPQDFLDKAEYPVRVDPTFGYTTIGASASFYSSGRIEGSAATGTTGTVSHIAHYAPGSTGLAASDYRAILYVQSTGAVQAHSDNTSYDGTTLGWIFTPIVNGNLTISSVSYWVAIGDGDGTMSSAFDSLASSSINADGTYDSINNPASIGASPLLQDQIISSYVVYSSSTPTDPGTYTEFFIIPGTTQWTAPTGVTEVIAACWGAGGGGGFISTSGGAGGGGGAFASSTLTVTAGNTYNIRIGKGGVADNESWAEASSFSTSTCPDCVIAAGGQGASPTSATVEGAGGTTASSTGTTKFAGGAGGDGNGTNDVGGGGGGAAGPHGSGLAGSSTSAGSTVGGNGGAGDNGSGGAGGAESSGNGNPGTSNPFGGGGGSGANDNRGGGGGSPGGGSGGGELAGNPGGDGQCTLTYTISAGGGTEESPKDEFQMIFSQAEVPFIHTLIAPPRKFYQVNDKIDV